MSEQNTPLTGGTGPTGIPGADKKMLVGLLGISSIFWGGFGVHKFILGYTKEGIIQVVLTLLCGIGAIIGLIEGNYLPQQNRRRVCRDLH